MPKTADDMTDAMIANMREKTGKALEQWLKIARKAKLAKHGEIVKHLKSEHGVTHGYASMIAHHALSGGEPAGSDDLVAAQYAGAKTGLRPIYDALAQAVRALGADAELAPKKTYVSLRRRKQFGLIHASTKTRVDVGVNLKNVAPKGRLEASGSFNAMVSHRVRVESVKDVDKELKNWLKRAYDAAG